MTTYFSEIIQEYYLNFSNPGTPTFQPPYQLPTDNTTKILLKETGSSITPTGRM